MTETVFGISVLLPVKPANVTVVERDVEAAVMRDGGTVLAEPESAVVQRELLVYKRDELRGVLDNRPLA